MAKKSHIREDGELGPCDAKPGNCPIKKTDLGEPYHGTPEEVSAEIERRNKEAYGPLGASLSKSAKWFHMDDKGNIVVCKEDGNCDPELKHEQLKHVHREDGPARERANGTKKWFHMDDKGNISVCKDDNCDPEFKREQLKQERPTAAQFNSNGRQFWKNSKRTPKYGPTAAQFNDADKWWKNGKPTG